MNNDEEARFAVTPSFVLTHSSYTQLYTICVLSTILMGFATSSYGNLNYKERQTAVTSLGELGPRIFHPEINTPR